MLKTEHPLMRLVGDCPDCPQLMAIRREACRSTWSSHWRAFDRSISWLGASRYHSFVTRNEEVEKVPPWTFPS